MKFSRYDQEYQTYSQWRDLCRDGCFHVVQTCVLKPFLPDDLLNKANIGVVMAVESSGSSVFVVNLNRKDINKSGSQIDQHPYIVAFDHSGSTARGGFVDHGDWENRTTTYMDVQTYYLVTGSGVLNHLPVAELPETSDGNITEIKVTSQNEAFITAFKLLVEPSEEKKRKNRRKPKK